MDAADLLGTLAHSLVHAYHGVRVTEEEPGWIGEPGAMLFICHWEHLV